jgi:hypothetical protein
MKFCCRGFQHHFESSGSRGFGVFSVGKFYKEETAFIIQHRALDADGDSPPFAPSPLSVVSEMHIQFCPWCGIQLDKFYGASPEIMKPDLKI